MKKKVLVPVVAILIVIVLAAIFYFSPKTFGKNVNPSDVDHINVFDGNTGVGFTIDNPDDIKYIVENIQGQSMRRDGISLLHMGYRFKVSYVDSNDKDVIPVFIVNGENTIRKDPFFYRCDGGLCVDYLRKLEDESENKSTISTTGGVDEPESVEEKWDYPPMVMVDGKLYIETGKRSTVDGRCGNMDGEITSTVDQTERPTENNQSNFGTGYGFQYGPTEGTIEIYMNDDWWVYATVEVKNGQTELASGVSMEVVEGTVTPTSATVHITNNTNVEIESGNAYDFSIEVYEDSKWDTIETGERTNTTEVLRFDGESDLNLTWENIYGELPAGKYRIVKDFFPWAEDGSYGFDDGFNRYAEFNVE